MRMELIFVCVVSVLCGVFAQKNISPEDGGTTLKNYVVSTILDYDSIGQRNVTQMNTVLLPKCCPYGYVVGPGNCVEKSMNFKPTFDVHLHNETAFDDVPINPEKIIFETKIHNPCVGKKFPVSPDESPIILLNGSLLLAGMGEYDGILGHDQFCIDNLDDPNSLSDETVYAFICWKVPKENYPLWVFPTYITLSTISAILFASSAVFFYKQDVHSTQKKSFMAYAISMTGTYSTIILMQFISGGCKFFGFLLQFFIVLSFAWLAVLCIDLARRIFLYRTKEKDRNFSIYTGCSCVFSSIFLIISFLRQTPDIPSSFFKPQFQKTICLGFDDKPQTGFFYAALLITVLASGACLIYSLIQMNKNRYHNNTEGIKEWKRRSRKLRYMYGSNLIVFVTMIIWLFDSFGDRLSITSSISIIVLFIQAFHGFIVVPIFTITTIQKEIDINQKPRIENLEDLIEVGKSCNRIY